MPPPAARRLAAFAAAAILLVALSPPARADPWFGYGDNALEDAFADGDVDEEDVVAMRAGAGTHAGVADVHGQSWISVVGFRRDLLSGKTDVGGILVVGLALDRIAEGSVHRVADPASPAPPLPVPTSPDPPAGGGASIDGSPRFARDCVAAAWRAAGLGDGDARIDAIVARSRASAWLPETRMRAMRLWDDAAHATTVTTTDDTTYYDALGANLILELRLTWRLDRLLYAGDETTLERVRMERQDARARVATRTLEALFAWERAGVDLRRALAGSREEADARLRLVEAEATLDVITGGWFADRAAPPSLTPHDPAVR